MLVKKDYSCSGQSSYKCDRCNADEKRRMIDILTGLFWDNFTNKK